MRLYFCESIDLGSLGKEQAEGAERGCDWRNAFGPTYLCGITGPGVTPAGLLLPTRVGPDGEPESGRLS